MNRQARWITALTLIAALCAGGCTHGGQSPAGAGLPPATSTNPDPAVTQARQAVADASATGATRWTGPTTGPPAQPGKTVVYVAQTLTNGGVAGALQGVEEAARTVGWTVRVLDGGGTQAGIQAALSAAISQRPDGIVISGFDAASVAPQLDQAAGLGIKVVGWHAAVEPGAIAAPPVFFNVATDATAVARLTAQFAIARSDGHSGAVILTDSSIPIAATKGQTLIETLQRCADCHVLAYVDIPIPNTTERVPQEISTLETRFGTAWTDALAVNDLYFDAAAPALRTAGKSPTGAPFNSSAGDGSFSAFDRIRRAQYQVATIPEPLYEQGWQIVDELNRAFAKTPPSGYVPAVHLINRVNVGAANVYDPANGYRDQYRAIWAR